MCCYKSIEVYYDISDIPGCDGTNPMDPNALPFRNEAMNLIGTALQRAGLGRSEGAEIGMGEVNLGFEVTDCDAAEAAVRAAVAGTPYEGIREIERFEEELDDA